MPLIYNINVIEAFLNAVKRLYYICHTVLVLCSTATTLARPSASPLIDPRLQLGLRPRSLLSPPPYTPILYSIVASLSTAHGE